MKFRIATLVLFILGVVCASLAASATNLPPALASASVLARDSTTALITNTSALGAIPLLLLFVEADRFKLEMTRNNRVSALSLVKMQQENLGEPRPGFLIQLRRGTHPSLGERIDFANSYHPWTVGKAGKYEHLFKGE